MSFRPYATPLIVGVATLFAFLGMSSAYAQTTPGLVVGNAYTFTLLDSTRVSGVVDSVTAEIIYFTHTKRGSDKVFRGAVARAESVSLAASGTSTVRVRQSPHGSRSLFAPTAIPMKRGELLYSNVLVEFNTVEYALTNHVSVGSSGLLFSSVLWGLQVAPTIKYAHSFSPTRHAAVGAVAALTLWQGVYDQGSVLPFAAFTWGTPDQNVTAGVGWVYDDMLEGLPLKKWARSPTAYVSGTKRVAPRWLVGGEYALTTFTATDTWVGGTTVTLDGTSNAGVAYARYLWPRVSLDLGLGVHVSHWGWPAILPLLGASVRL